MIHMNSKKIKSSFLQIICFLIVLSLFSCSKSDPVSNNTTPSYTKVSINKVTIVSFPSNDAGNTWDPLLEGYDPDVYFQFTYSGTTTLIYDWGTSSRKENLVSSDLPWGYYMLNGQAIYTHYNLSQSIDIDLWDYDTLDSDDYMGTATFNIANYTTGANKYPSSIIVTSGATSIQLSLTWLP